MSETWARELLRANRANGADPAVVRTAMEERLASETGAATCARRKITVEPPFGNLKANLRFRRFSRRGLPAVTSEWHLV
ncbi:MAG: transposase [Acidimicrobiia bacterium]